MMNLSSSIKVNRGGLCALGVIFFLIILYYRHSGGEKVKSSEEDLISLKELLSAAIDSAKRGGNEVRRVREQASLHMQSKGKTEEGVNDPVTDGDMKSHIQMFYSLSKAFPGLKIISEEHDSSKIEEIVKTVTPADVRNKEIEQRVPADEIIRVGDVKVWIDPLDATKEYTEDLRQYVTTMVGIAVRGVPVIGVIHRPFSDETHWAWLGHGMSKDLQTIKEKMPLTKAENVLAPRVIVSISHQGEVLKVAKKAFGEGATVIPAAGAGYKIMEVIRNNADLYMHTSLIKKWDLCAGHAILRAMGGTLTSLENSSASSISYGDSQDYKVQQGLLGAIHNHQQFFDKLKNLKKKR